MFTSIPPFTYQHDTLKMPTASLPSFPSVLELHKKTHSCPLQPLLEKVDNTFSIPLSPLALHKYFATTCCLFFIQYIPEDTIKPRWFLVQVNHHETKILEIDSLRTEEIIMLLSSLVILLKKYLWRCCPLVA